MFDGFIDDLRVYNTVLGSGHAEELYFSRNLEFAPVISQAIAYSSGLSDVLATGDNLTLSFSSATNEPDLSTKFLIDQVLDWNGKSLGDDYSGVWSDNVTLVITISNAANLTLGNGDEIEVIPGLGLYGVNNPGLLVHGTQAVELRTYDVFSDNLVAHYTFDSLANKRVVDHVAGNHLTIYGTPTLESGAVGSGLTFDGNTAGFVEGVDLANSSFSLAFWEKKNSFGSNETLVMLGDTGSNGEIMRASYNTTDFFEHDLWGASHNSSVNITTTQWRHWAVTFDKVNEGKVIYLNGNLHNVSQSNGISFTGSNQLHVGTYLLSSEFTTSSLDDLMIFNRELSSSEVEFLYENSLLSSAAPSLLYAVAKDEQRDLDGITNGDNLVLYFDQRTNEPSVGTKSDVDNLIDFSNYSLGANYIGAWSDNWTLVVEVTDATGANLAIGAELSVLSSGNLRNESETSAISATANVSISGNWGVVSDANIMVYLPFDETTGLVATEVKSGRNGVLDGGMDDSDWVAGYRGNAIHLDGSSDEVRIGSGNVNLANESFTTSVWVKRGSTGSDDYIFSQGTNSSSNGLHFGFRSSNIFTLAFWGNDLNADAIAMYSQWQHWVCTFNVSTKKQTIYLNGVLYDDRTATANYQGSGDFIIGSRFGSLNFDGLIDEVIVYDYDLSATEVLHLYDSY